MLVQNDYLPIYRSLVNDLDREFFIPSYRESVFLERGVGFFSLGSLILDIDGIMSFLENGGKIHLVCNPRLSEEDINIIIAGQKLDKDCITKTLLQQISIESCFSEIELAALDVICNMICEKRLIIKIAYMPNGLYHEKIGIFTDAEGNKIYFSGSANETVNAKIYNAECIGVALSWDGGKKMIELQQDYFNKLWNNCFGEKLQVMDFPEAVEKQIFEKYRKNSSLEQAIEDYQKRKSGRFKQSKKLYPYQKKAIDEFVNNEYAHFYEMATGTGKTFTAVKTVERAISEKGPLFVIVCVPQTDLQPQWKAAFEECGFEDIYYIGGLAAGKSDENYDDASILFYGEHKTAVCIAVYDTFFAKFANQCQDIDSLFFIVDEAHNLTPSYLKAVPKAPLCRLGLSATLERFEKFQADGIKSFFTKDKNETFIYSIEEAIDAGYLSHYRYHPIIVYLNDEETNRYKAKSKALALEMSQEDRDEDKISRLRTERSLIIKQASGKLVKLKNMGGGYPFRNSVVYCGQGKAEEESIIDRVTQIVHDMKLRVSQFTSKTVDRTKVLEKFSQGYFDVLVAIKCFDEGVDVPKLDKIYILSSDSSLRQTVQRRGRVLRLCAESGKREANIYDMVVLPTLLNYGSGCRSIIASELARFSEYNRLSDNFEENKKIIDDIMKMYNLTEENLSNEE